ncbi:hypothetical protein PFISCL1PPCAC_25402, partial [Pristionchus fissidentatus]
MRPQLLLGRSRTSLTGRGYGSDRVSIVSGYGSRRSVSHATGEDFLDALEQIRVETADHEVVVVDVVVSVVVLARRHHAARGRRDSRGERLLREYRCDERIVRYLGADDCRLACLEACALCSRVQRIAEEWMRRHPAR